MCLRISPTSLSLSLNETFFLTLKVLAPDQGCRIIMASDGLWDNFTFSQVGEGSGCRWERGQDVGHRRRRLLIPFSALPMPPSPPSQAVQATRAVHVEAAAAHLVKACSERAAKVRDDTSVFVIDVLPAVATTKDPPHGASDSKPPSLLYAAPAETSYVRGLIMEKGAQPSSSHSAQAGPTPLYTFPDVAAGLQPWSATGRLRSDLKSKGFLACLIACLAAAVNEPKVEEIDSRCAIGPGHLKTLLDVDASVVKSSRGMKRSSCPPKVESSGSSAGTADSGDAPIGASGAQFLSIKKSSMTRCPGHSEPLPMIFEVCDSTAGVCSGGAQLEIIQMPDE